MGKHEAVAIELGEWIDITVGSSHYQPTLGVLASLDPWEGSCARAMSLNGYSWVEGNVINAIDPSGICWDHPMTTSDQQNQCLTAWTTYASSVDLGDATKRDLLNQEDAYWGGLSYSEFVHLWNDNVARPPSSYSPGTEILKYGTLLAVGTSQADTPALGPADALALGVLGCALVLAGAANLIGTIALSQRQYYAFSQITFSASTGKRAISNLCPPCPRPSPKCHVDRVPPSIPHPPCLVGDHYHEILVDQNPLTCQCFQRRQSYLTLANCIPQGAAPPNPPCDTWI